jgi:L-2-hydroxyglutarate oxidase LhgO
MSEHIDCVVIGAGVIGLAVARQLALSGREVLILERTLGIGNETSSRNSEVIHAGIYYPPGSLKARLCVEGKQLLYRYCSEHGVPHERVGKIIVATAESQRTALVGYQARARANGVGELPWLSAGAIGELEPEVACIGGLYSQSTGIIDSHAYMLSLQGGFEAAGGMIAFGTTVQRITRAGRRLRVETDAIELDAREVVNSAGLAAPGLATTLDPGAPRAWYARGHYYAYSGAQPFSRLVYPVADQGGLGVHVTIDLARQARFGPDVRWIDGIDYRFDDSHRAEFVAAIRRYYPAVDERRLHPAYTGIRPKIAGPGEPDADFRIDDAARHGVAGLVNLLGIESPGLTASLAIARVVEQCLNSA